MSTATPNDNAAARYTNAIPVGDEILYGADAIATFLLGDRKLRRRIYDLVEEHLLPVFRIGANICARKSVLLRWIEAQERNNGAR